MSSLDGYVPGRGSEKPAEAQHLNTPGQPENQISDAYLAAGAPGAAEASTPFRPGCEILEQEVPPTAGKIAVGQVTEDPEESSGTPENTSSRLGNGKNDDEQSESEVPPAESEAGSGAGGADVPPELPGNSDNPEANDGEPESNLPNYASTNAGKPPYAARYEISVDLVIAHAELGRETPARFPVSDAQASWDAPYPEYDPPFIDLPQGQPRAERGREQTAPVDQAEVPGARSLETSEIQRDDQGLPLNPLGRTGLAGRGTLKQWGSNLEATSIVTRRELEHGLLQVLVVPQDSGGWALPSRSVEPGEELQTAVMQGVADATHALDLHAADVEPVYAGAVDDPQNTDNAWLEVVASHLPLDYGELGDTIVDPSTTDANSPRWVGVDENLAYLNLPLSQTQLLLLAVENEKARLSEPQFLGSKTKRYEDYMSVELFEEGYVFWGETTDGSPVSLPYTYHGERVVGGLDGSQPYETFEPQPTVRYADLPEDARAAVETALRLEDPHVLGSEKIPRYRRLNLAPGQPGESSQIHTAPFRPGYERVILPLPRDRVYFSDESTGKTLDLAVKSAEKVGTGWLVVPNRDNFLGVARYQDAEINFFGPEGANAFWVCGNSRHISADGDPRLMKADPEDPDGQIPLYSLVPVQYYKISTEPTSNSGA